MWMSSRKPEIIPGFHFHITEINSKHQSSFFFSSKVELMLSLSILNRLKSFTKYFLMFAISWIYWKIELLQNVDMKRNNKFYWYVKKFSFDYLLASLCIIFQPNHNWLTCFNFWGLKVQGNTYGKHLQLKQSWKFES